MKIGPMLRLLALAAIWGFSYICMRVVTPVLGPILTANIRVLLAGFAFLLYYSFSSFDPEWRKNGRHYLVMGVLHAAIPFSLIAYAASRIPPAYPAILNATTPLFGALFSWLWLKEPMSSQKAGGLLLAFLGVGLVAQVGSSKSPGAFLFPVLACLGAAICYALATIYLKKWGAGTKPLGVAGCSQLLAGLILLPLSTTQRFPVTITTNVIVYLLILALVCSAAGYIIYYQLLAEIGPTKTLTVTFLLPLFTMVWSALFWDHQVTWDMLGGAVVILGGTWLVVRQKPKKP